MTGKPNGLIPASSYDAFNFTNDVPVSPDTHVVAVEEKLRHHMDEMALGSPVVPNRTVKSVMDELMAMQGFKLEGDGDQAFAGAVAYIQRMLAECTQAKKVIATDTDYKAKVEALEAELKAAKEAELKAKEAELKAKEELVARVGGSAVSSEAKDAATTDADILNENEKEIARLTSLLLESRKQLEDSLQVTYFCHSRIIEAHYGLF